MSHFTTRNLFEEITYWAPTSNVASNAFGHAPTSIGVLIKGRWQDKEQLIRRANGEEIISMAEVFVDRDVMINGFLLRGDYAGQALQATATEIQDFRKTPDFRNLGHERRAFL